jgi:hypothetical protein
MRFPHTFVSIAALAAIALSLLATPAAISQTVISNETLVSTTFVVNKQSVTANCGRTGCRVTKSMFAPVSVTCPGATGQTCTFHISIDTKTAISFRCGGQQCFGGGPTAFYQFLVDGIAPTIGPTDANGDYIIGKNVFTTSVDKGWAFQSRQNYPASVLATVTNSNSNNHTIAVSVGCADTLPAFGCEATALSTTMRVDVFEP